jgi:hypothetical protein
VTIVVQSTTTTSVSKAGMRIDFSVKVGLPTEYKLPVARASASIAAPGRR